MKDTLIIATRGSALALWQANHIKSLLERHFAEQGTSITVTLRTIKTKGDIITDVPLAKVGGKGLFVKEIETALLDGTADLAVHSVKDVPMEIPPELTLAAFPTRESRFDVLLSEKYESLEALPENAVVGTSSLRRQMQLAKKREDLDIRSLRGNVDTRLRKLKDGEFDAVVMAEAGIRRLGLTAKYVTQLLPSSFYPAVGQGALAVECRKDNAELLEAVKFLDDPVTRMEVEAERGFSATLNGGCQAPIGVYTEYFISPDEIPFLRITGHISSVPAGRVMCDTVTFVPYDRKTPQEAGIGLAKTMLGNGADDMLAEILRHSTIESI